MTANDPQAFAARLYSRIPSQYRVLDEEQERPLLALMQVIGEQAAILRQNLDDIWDDFFIETCDDWVVPYLGALVGAKLLSRPVGQSNRLDVRNTVLWRRSKGAPRMLQALATAISGWPAGLSEFFQTLGWTQNVNHLRLTHPLTAGLRDPYALSLLGRADDPFAHTADFKPARALDLSPVTPSSLGIGRAAFGTPGRYQIRNVGLFLQRLRMFPVAGVTPASAAPGPAPDPSAAFFTFNPLFRDVPLFIAKTGEPLTRAAFRQAPWKTFGVDVAVRHFGVLLANDQQPAPDLSTSNTPFTFGGAGAGLRLNAADGMRLLDPRPLAAAGGVHFIISAELRRGVSHSPLGTFSTQLGAFLAGGPTTTAGQLVCTVELGRPTADFPALHPSPPARFPGAVLAVRAENPGVPRRTGALYVYLPPASLVPGALRTFFVADDGSTNTAADLNSLTVARPSEGQVYPPRVLNPSTGFASNFTQLNRGPGGVRLPDPTRFGNAQVLIQVNLFTGAFQALGAIATISQSGAAFPDLEAPATWPAFTYAPSKNAVRNNLPDIGVLAVNVRPLTGNFVPAFELVLVNRAGESLLVYIPESPGVTAQGKDYFIADDGSTYDPPPDRTTISSLTSLSGLALARAAAGQVLPIPGVLPLEQRRPTALDLCRAERRTLLLRGELGIDPELGRFAFAPNDPAIGKGELSVDYVEALSDRTGAHNFDRQLDPKSAATLFVAQSGDAPRPAGRPVFATLAAAFAAAHDGDVIEFADSRTYSTAEVTFNNAAVRNLTVRAAANQRPCLTFYTGAGTPTPASIRFVSALDKLELNGLFMSGGPLRLDRAVKQLAVIACTLDPRSAQESGSVVALDADQRARAEFLFCRTICAGIRAGTGVSRIIVADSILDQPRGSAIKGLRDLSSPPDPSSAEFVNTVQLERVTVLGRIRCVTLQASECLLDDLVFVEDQQSGCIRFSRFELGSILPRRFQCIPSEAQASAVPAGRRPYPPLFHSRRFGRPDYAQLASACPPEILSASEAQAEVGAFASALNAVRANNLQLKLIEFLPVGLTSVLIAGT